MVIIKKCPKTSNDYGRQSMHYSYRSVLFTAVWSDPLHGKFMVTHIRDTGLDSANGRASASGMGGCGFDTWPRHTKGVKNGTSGYLAWRSAL